MGVLSDVFTKAGAGTLTLAGRMTYQGITHLQQGDLIVTHDNALGLSQLRTDANTQVFFNSPNPLVHGLSGCWQNWLENLPHFGRTHRAIALDLPGFGASPMPSWPIDMPAYGRLLHYFCEKLGVGSGHRSEAKRHGSSVPWSGRR